MNDKPIRRFQSFSLTTLILFAVFFAITVWSFEGSNFSWSKLFGSKEYLLRFLGEAFPPISNHRLTTDDFIRYLKAMAETFQMAFAGTVLGVVFGFVLALLASKNLLFRGRAGQGINIAAKALISLFRTVPDLVWAIIFVVVVGLGAFAGTLTIMVDTIGFVGRFFAEAMEDTEKSPAEALECCGATRIDSTFAAVIPAALPSMITTSLFAFEKAIRSSVILGLVGAGGIGLQLNSLFNWFAYDRAMVIIGMIFVLVISVEQISTYAREKILENEKQI